MKVIDVHPEDLLDRELAGTLSDDQRALLDVHLASCESCRMERLLRADFAAEAARAGDAQLQSFVLGALQRVAAGEALPQAAGAEALAAPVAVPAQRTRRRVWALLALASVLLMAAGAAASRSGWVERIFHLTFGEATVEGQNDVHAKPAGKELARASEPTRTAEVVAKASPPRVALPPPPVVIAPSTGSEAAPEAPARLEGASFAGAAKREPARVVAPHTGAFLTDSVVSRPAPRTARITNVRRTPVAQPIAPVPAKVAPNPEPPVPSAPAAVDPSRVAAQAAAAALFEQANRARRSGKLDQAGTLYENLQLEFASSAEAKLSFALSGRMWLDAGNAFAALGAFERYLATGERALREEAMTGRALALERLGRHSAADAAFSELLQAYPYSSYAPLAKKRLGQD